MRISTIIYRVIPILIHPAMLIINPIYSQGTGKYWNDHTAVRNINDMSLRSIPPLMRDSFKFVMGTDYFAPPNDSVPKKAVPFIDPNFHATIKRITDSTDNYIGPGIENEYATSSPENSDGSLIILRGNTAAWYLYNAKTFQAIKQLIVFDPCNQEAEPRWDISNPKKFYYLCTTELKSYDVDTDTSITIHDFKTDIPSAEIVTSHSYGDASIDQRYWCFYLQDANYNLLSIIVYDKTLNKVVGQKSSGFPDNPRSVTMSPSGNYCVIGFENITYAQVYSRDFNSEKNLTDGSNGHNDVAQTSDGRDVLVYQNVSTDYIAMTDLQTGIETPLVKIPFVVNPDIGLHVSGNCSQTPGWVLVSTYGAKNPPQNKTHSWMDTQLFMLELKTNPRIWRVAHTHAYTSLDFTGGKIFFAEAFGAINSKGNRVYFGSNWDNFSPEYSDAYQVILPDGWESKMPPQTAIHDGENAPWFVSLEQNYPNPFAQSTAISFWLLAFSHVRLEVYDMLGRRVETIVDEWRDAGEHIVTFSIRNGDRLLQPGLYIYQLDVAGHQVSRKMMVIE